MGSLLLLRNILSLVSFVDSLFLARVSFDGVCCCCPYRILWNTLHKNIFIYIFYLCLTVPETNDCDTKSVINCKNALINELFFKLACPEVLLSAEVTPIDGSLVSCKTKHIFSMHKFFDIRRFSSAFCSFDV